MYKRLAVFVFKTFWRCVQDRDMKCVTRVLVVQWWGGGRGPDSSMEKLLSLWEGS